MTSFITQVQPTPVDTRTIATGERLSSEELRKMHAYWRACTYLAAGMIYLRSNPLLRDPLKPEHIKKRLLGHWGTSPGLSFMWVHLNRLINKYDLDAIFLAGPGHGEEDGVEVVLVDQAIEMNPHEAQARARTPVTQQALLDVL